MLQNDSITEQYVFKNHSQIEGTVDPTIIFGPQRDTLYIVIPVTVIYSVIFVTGVLGNIFTCIVIIKNKSMHTATNYYLFSLAVSDLLLLVSGMPQEMYSIWSKWPYVFGAAFCLIRGLAAETSTNASILTITLFTIERYLAICHPFQSHKMSKLSRATKHVILLWVVSFLLALPQALQFGLRTHRGVVICMLTRVIIAHSFEISTFLLFLAPMVLISVLYFLIGLKLRESNNGKVQKHSRRSENPAMLKVNKRYGSATRKVVKMLVAVVVAFFTCWAPFHAQRLVAIYGTTENHHARSKYLHFAYHCLTYLSGVFYYLSTCINPILYHIMCNKFREAFKDSKEKRLNSLENELHVARQMIDELQRQLDSRRDIMKKQTGRINKSEETYKLVPTSSSHEPASSTVMWCCFSGKGGDRERRFAVHAFARVPTFSGSENSGNNNYKKDSKDLSKKRSSSSTHIGIEKTKKNSITINMENLDEHHHDLDHRIASTFMIKTNEGIDREPKLNEDCIIESPKSEADAFKNFKSSIEKNEDQFTRDAPPPVSPVRATPVSISNSSLKELKHEDLKDELSSYLNDIIDRNASKAAALP